MLIKRKKGRGFSDQINDFGKHWVEPNRFLRTLSRVFALLAWQQHSAFARFTHRASGMTRVFEKCFGKIYPNITSVPCHEMLPSMSPQRCHVIYYLHSVSQSVAFFQNHLGCLVNREIPGPYHRPLELESPKLGHSLTSTLGDSYVPWSMRILKFFSDSKCLMNTANIAISSIRFVCTHVLAHWFNKKWFTVVSFLTVLFARVIALVRLQTF